jgi:hypothetical protein
VSSATWGIAIGMAAVVLIVHLLGRWFIILPRELKISQKKIDSDMEKIRKREEE